jgi:CTD small phosphatase-like protein 2
MYADTVINYIDPESKYISHRLYRQHCTFEKGMYLKDLRNINRNHEDMAIVDNSSISYAIQPENGIPIIPFYDNNKDR